MIKLNNSNWMMWKPRMEDILFCKNLHEPIKGAAAKTENMFDADQRKLNRKAIGHIRQWVDDSVFHHVSNETDAYALWGKLESFFEQKAATKKAFLIKELIDVKYKDDIVDTKKKNRTPSFIFNRSERRLTY